MKCNVIMVLLLHPKILDGQYSLASEYQGI